MICFIKWLEAVLGQERRTKGPYLNCHLELYQLYYIVHIDYRVDLILMG